MEKERRTVALPTHRKRGEVGWQAETPIMPYQPQVTRWPLAITSSERISRHWAGYVSSNTKCIFLIWHSGIYFIILIINRTAPTRSNRSGASCVMEGAMLNTISTTSKAGLLYYSLAIWHDIRGLHGEIMRPLLTGVVHISFSSRILNPRKRLLSQDLGNSRTSNAVK